MVEFQNRGFTLIEMVVYIGISTMILTALTALTVVVIRSSANQAEQVSIINEINLLELKLDDVLRNIEIVDLPITDSSSNVFLAERTDGGMIEIRNNSNHLEIIVNDELIYKSINSLLLDNLIVTNTNKNLYDFSFDIKSSDSRSSNISQKFDYKLSL